MKRQTTALLSALILLLLTVISILEWKTDQNLTAEEHPGSDSLSESRVTSLISTSEAARLSPEGWNPPEVFSGLGTATEIKPFPRGNNQDRRYPEPQIRPLDATLSSRDPVVLAKMPADGRTNLAPLEIDQYTKLGRRLAFNPEAFESIIRGETTRILAPSVGQDILMIEVEKLKTRTINSHTFQGRVVGEESDSSAQFIYHDGVVHGNVVRYSKGQELEYRILSDGHMMVREIDQEAVKGSCGCIDESVAQLESPQPPKDEDPKTSKNSVAKDSSTENKDTIGRRVVDIVVGYGRDARIADGGAAQIEARIIAAVERMTTAFSNSGIENAELMLVGTIEDPDYRFGGTNFGSQVDEFNDLVRTGGNRSLDTVLQYRNDLGADFCAFVPKDADGSLGIAQIGGYASISARTAMTATGLTFCHELGHCLGCDHAWGDSGYGNHSRYAWRITVPGGEQVRTIMSYDQDWARILNFSNPNVLYNGVPTGAFAGDDIDGNLTVDQRFLRGGRGFPGADLSQAGFDGSNPELGAFNASVIDVGGGSSQFGLSRAMNRRRRIEFDVKSPIAGDIWRHENTEAIVFTAGDMEDLATIQLFKGGVLIRTLGVDLNPGTKSHFRWEIPTDLAPGSDYMVRVSLTRNGGELVADSGFFSIAAPQFGVISYRANGADAGQVPVDQQKRWGRDLPLASNPNNLALAGFSWDGWNTAPDGSGTAYASEAIYSNDADLILYASWNVPPIALAGPDQNLVLGGGALWSPSSLSPQAWYDGGAPETVISSLGLVSEWRDKSGNNRHATQSNTEHQPTVVASGGNPVTLDFYGDDQFFDLNLDYLAGVPHSAFVMISDYGFTGLYGAAESGNGDRSLNVGLLDKNSYRFGHPQNDWSVGVSDRYLVLDEHLVNYLWIPNARKEIFVNGISEGFTTNAGSIGTMAGGGRLGKVGDASALRGWLSEVIFFTWTLTDAERERVEGYLAHKWGRASALPNAHPYKQSPPSGLGVTTSLAGSITDSDDSSPSVRWSVVSGPGPVVFSNYLSTTSEASFAKAGVYVLRLTGSDGSGSGSSEVTINVATGSPYTNWTGQVFSKPFTTVGPAEDQDQDSFSNILEYALGLDPTSGANGKLAYTENGSIQQAGPPTLELISDAGSDVFSAVFLRRKDYEAAGLSYNVEFSANLNHWTRSPIPPTVVTGPENQEAVDVLRQQFPLTVPLESGELVAPRFFRISVERQQP